MKVFNQTSSEIIAFGWHREKGYGRDVRIFPGQCADVHGPYLHKVDGKELYVFLQGEIVCTENPDGGVCFQVTLGKRPRYEEGQIGITIRHHLDHPEDFVAQWKKNELW